MPEEPLKKPNAKPGVPEDASPLSPEETELLERADKPEILNDLDTVGGLQVEQMRESNELQARRRGIRETVQEQTHVDMDSEPESEEEEDGGGLVDLLREANLSPRHLKFCCSGVVVLGLIVAAFFGAHALFSDWPPSWWFSSDSNSTTETNVVPEESASEPVSQPENFQFLDEGLLTGILLGEEKITAPDQGPVAGANLGEELTSSDSFAGFVADFKKMFEAMEVKVPELLDQSRDRQATLTDYRNELNYLLYLGKQNVSALEGINEALVTQFEEKQARKDQLEGRFFEQLSDLDANASTASLNEFIAEAEGVVRLRAQHQARERLILFYSRLIEQMEIRVQDITLNEEALVKGVKVVEIQGSDLDLILQVEE